MSSANFPENPAYKWQRFDDRRAFSAGIEAKRWASDYRFGIASDFSLIFEEESISEKTLYIVSLFIVGIILITLFVCWCIAVCVMRKRRRRGFLSGDPLRESPQPDKDSRSFRRARRVRFSYILCGLLHLVTIFVCMKFGVKQLDGGASRFSAAAFDLDLIVNRALDVTARYLTEFFQETVQLYQVVTGAREALGNDCDLLFSPQVEGAWNDTIDAFRNFTSKGISNETLNTIQDVFGTLTEVAVKIEEYSDGVDLLGWQSAIFLALYSLVPTALVVPALFAHYRVYVPGLKRAVDWVIFPLFCVLTGIAVFGAAGMALGAGLTGDFCLPSGRESTPEDTVRNIVVREGFPPGHPLFRTVEFYIEQCEQDVNYTPLVTLLLLLGVVDTAQKALVTFLYLRGPSVQGFGIDTVPPLVCGIDATPLEVLSQYTTVFIGALENIIIDLLDVTQCSIVVPRYLVLAHDGTCAYSQDALAWIFSFALTISVCGVVMITLRSAHSFSVPEELRELSPSDALTTNLATGADGPDGTFTEFPEYDGMEPPVDWKKPFTLYSAHAHQDVRASLPTEDEGDKGELDEGWQALSEDEKDYWQRWSDWDQKRWERDCAVYNARLGGGIDGGSEHDDENFDMSSTTFS